VTKVSAETRIVYGPDGTMAVPTRALDRLGRVPTYNAETGFRSAIWASGSIRGFFQGCHHGC
jgi:hypothetical protein